MARRPGGHAWSLSRRPGWRGWLGNKKVERKEARRKTFELSKTVHQARRKVDLEGIFTKGSLVEDLCYLLLLQTVKG